MSNDLKNYSKECLLTMSQFLPYPTIRKFERNPYEPQCEEMDKMDAYHTIGLEMFGIGCSFGITSLNDPH